MSMLRVQRPFLWLAETGTGPILQSYLSSQPSVFHATDPFRHPNDVSAAATLARGARLVLAVSTAVLENIAAYNPNTILFPNAWSFPAATIAPEIAPDLRNIPAPRLGVVSYLSSNLDYSLLYDIATQVPASLVVIGSRIGRLSTEENSLLRRMQSRANVHFLGGRPTNCLPSYLVGLDVCLAPYKDNDRIYGSDPLKIYQYLAFGKKVVSRPVRALEAQPGLVRVASRSEAFIDCIDAAIASRDDEGAIMARIAFAKATSWDQRWKDLTDDLAGDPATQEFIRFHCVSAEP